MATPYDRNFKLLLEDDPRALIELVLELPAECILETYDREINIESLRADHLLRVRMENGESLIHLEALTWYDKGWARSQISKAALITIKYWLPLKSLVVLLTPKRVPKRVAHELVEYTVAFECICQWTWYVCGRSLPEEHWTWEAWHCVHGPC